VGRSVRTLNEFVVLPEANALLETLVGAGKIEPLHPEPLPLADVAAAAFSAVVVFISDPAAADELSVFCVKVTSSVLETILLTVFSFGTTTVVVVTVVVFGAAVVIDVEAAERC
jgi:hypothetical protein